MGIVLTLALVLFALLSIYSIADGIAEIIKNHRNPIPKFANGDKYFNEIKTFKIRKITPFRKGEDRSITPD